MSIKIKIGVNNSFFNYKKVLAISSSNMNSLNYLLDIHIYTCKMGGLDSFRSGPAQARPLSLSA